MQKSIYFPDDAKTKEVLKRVEARQNAQAKVLGRRPSFSEIILEALKKLVSVKNN